MRTIALVLVFSATLIGCAPNVQVVTLRGSNVKPTPEGLVLDTDTLTLQYSFASERGIMNITVLNKLNQPLYVDWQRSSFIIGQKTFNYWSDVATVQLSSSGYIYQYGRSNVSSIRMSSIGNIAKEVPIAFIPPHSKIIKQRFVVFPTGLVPASGNPVERREQARWSSNPKKVVNVYDYAYQNAQSPLQFRNYLTLSTNKEFATEFGIDTHFWASGIRVEPEPQAIDVIHKMPDGSYVAEKSFSQKDSFFISLP